LLNGRIEIEKGAPFVFPQRTERLKSTYETEVTSAKEAALTLVAHERFNIIGTERKPPGRAIPGRVLDEKKGVVVEAEVARFISNFGDAGCVIVLD
jgi:hypothetical protein